MAEPPPDRSTPSTEAGGGGGSGPPVISIGSSSSTLSSDIVTGIPVSGFPLSSPFFSGNSPSHLTGAHNFSAGSSMTGMNLGSTLPPFMQSSLFTRPESSLAPTFRSASPTLRLIN